MIRPATAPVAVLIEPMRASDPEAIALRGNHVVFRPGETNRCPGCSGTHWQVGRVTAECFLCGTALAIVDGGTEQ